MTDELDSGNFEQREVPESEARPAVKKVSDLTLDELSTVISQQVSDVLRQVFASNVLTPGGAAGVHVNSGPPGHANVPGHANFTGSPHVNSGPPGHANEPGHANFDPSASVGRRVGVDFAGAHVNSGPPGHANEPGHANFDPSTRVGGRIGGDFAGVHVNSGPPGHANEPGHANFDPKSQATFRATIVTLPDGLKVSLPAGGPINMNIHGFNIRR